jgi:hypothetical protein
VAGAIEVSMGPAQRALHPVIRTWQWDEFIDHNKTAFGTKLAHLRDGITSGGEPQVYVRGSYPPPTHSMSPTQCGMHPAV